MQRIFLFIKLILTYSMLKKLLHFFQTYGVKRTLLLIIMKMSHLGAYTYKERFQDDAVIEDILQFKKKPLISIIMPVFNVDPLYLAKAIESVKKQLYPHWELCIADDCSTNNDTLKYLKAIDHPLIKILFLKKNGGISIASNQAASLASGEYLALLDNDDTLTRDALFEVVKSINERDADIIYSDEDFIDKNGKSRSAHFKPDFSPDLLLSHNYITHLLVVRKKIFDQVKGFSSTYDGAQDYDLILKITEIAHKIHHIQKILYHWRMIKTSTSYNPESKKYAHDAGKRAVMAAVKRRKLSAEVLSGTLIFYYRVKHKIINNDLVSIIIPFKDKPQLLQRCLASILTQSAYPYFEIIGINNNSTNEQTLKTMQDFARQDQRIRFYEYNYQFNFAAINNYGVSLAKGKHILLMNNDIEVLNADWLLALLEHSQREEVGAVGGKLFFPDKTIQHAGVIIGINGYAGHSHKGVPADANGYFGKLNCIQNVSAVTGALLMVKKQLYKKMHGLTEGFAVAFNDIDFCLRLRERGYINIFTPYCEAVHYESASRGSDQTQENKLRFESEKALFINRHKKILTQGDPYYNPQLSLKSEKFYIAT